MRLAMGVLALGIAATAAGHHPTGDAVAHRSRDAEAAPTSPSPTQKAARILFSDRRLLTQRGDEVAFYSDVLRGKIVLLHLIFTQCADACPSQTATVAQVQKLLAPRVGSEFALVSITVDPERDTPQVLRDYAAKFDAKDGWLFLTGSKRDVDDVLRRLGRLAPTREAHTSLFMLGNVDAGQWLNVHPLAAPEEIARRMRSLAEAAPAPRSAR